MRARDDRTIVGVDVGFVYDSLGRVTGAIDVRVHRRGARSIGPVAMIASMTPASSRDTMRAAHSDAIRPGVRIANPHCTFGTLGLIVFDTMTKRPLIMSSSHVLGDAQSTKADVNLIPAGTARPRQIATFSRGVNDVRGDAAVAELIDLGNIDRAPTTGTMIARAAMPQLGDIVEKVGAATGRTYGVVDGLGHYFFSGDSAGMLGFRIVSAMPNGARAIAQPGDSGAAWYRQADQVGVGLHVGGDRSFTDESSQPAIACYLSLVLDALAVSLTPPE